MGVKEVREYKRQNGKNPFGEWFDALKDVKGKAIIRTRLRKLSLGLFGDYGSVGGGVYELRIFFGPGYRIYFGMDGKDVILLLLGGDKGTQQRDIKMAREYWLDYLA
ncbi:MAG: type II toxin-antitoxin system RelE/ParE family toxin [Nitrospinae bacterium]|nr:type II toxin-antitoxin system RelE/ParE family toxin [Nitrospinota bacterium]